MTICVFTSIILTNNNIHCHLSFEGTKNEKQLADKAWGENVTMIKLPYVTTTNHKLFISDSILLGIDNAYTIQNDYKAYYIIRTIFSCKPINRPGG